MLTRKEFIERFHLTRTKTKCCFYDGLTAKVRTLYINNNGELYVIYNNDLHVVKPFKYNDYMDGMEEIKCHLCAGYSWYH